MSKSWSQQVWEAAAPVYDAIVSHPFVRQLADGTLSYDKFVFYLQQDALYLDNYCRVLAHIASRLPKKEQAIDFLGFAADGVAVEKAMHEVYLADMDKTDIKSPSCLLYCSLLAAQATAPVEVEAAAVLPCFWVYNAVGKHIAATAAQSNPYRNWIDTYSDEAFDISNARAIAICDSLAEATGEDTRRRMTDIFVMCTKMEWMFWDSAFNTETWKI